MNDANLTAAILARARGRDEQTCIRFVGDDAVHDLSCGEFAERVTALMLGLDELGLRRGARIGLSSQNRWEWLLIDLAAAGRGVTTISLDPAWSDSRVVAVLDYARAESVFVETVEDGARMARLSDGLPNLQAIVVIDSPTTTPAGLRSLGELLDAGRRAQDEDRVAELLAAVEDGDVATIMFTGGSTGEPKAVQRTHGNALSRGWASFPWMGNESQPDPDPGDVLLDPLSFCHAAGLWWAQHALLRGGTLALPGSAALSLRDLELLAPTHIMAVPRVVLGMQKQLLPHVEDLLSRVESLPANDPALARIRSELSDQIRARLGGRVRRILWAGGAMAANLLDFFEAADIRMLSAYGGTELGLVALASTDSPRGTSGTPGGADVRIEEGEILVRGPGVTPGYLDNPAATAMARAEGGWWRTGDAGELDNAGRLALTGRSRAMFNCYEGTNIDPAELEQLLEADPYVLEAILVGHRRPFLAALIVPDQAKLDASDVDEACAYMMRRIDRLNRSLEDFERIRQVRLVDTESTALVRRVTVAQKIRIDRDAVDRVFAGPISEIYATQDGPSKTIDT